MEDIPAEVREEPLKPSEQSTEVEECLRTVLIGCEDLLVPSGSCGSNNLQETEGDGMQTF